MDEPLLGFVMCGYTFYYYNSFLTSIRKTYGHNWRYNKCYVFLANMYYVNTRKIHLRGIICAGERNIFIPPVTASAKVYHKYASNKYSMGGRNMIIFRIIYRYDDCSYR